MLKFCCEHGVKYLSAHQQNVCRACEENGPYVDMVYENESGDQRHVTGVRFPLGYQNDTTLHYKDDKTGQKLYRTPNATEDGTEPRIWFKSVTTLPTQRAVHGECRYGEWVEWLGSKFTAEPAPGYVPTIEEQQRYAAIAEKHKKNEAENAAKEKQAAEVEAQLAERSKALKAKEKELEKREQALKEKNAPALKQS